MENKKKTYYYDLSLEELKKIDKTNKPTIGLHTCCAPCALFPLEFLYNYFHIVLLFDNSNIYPEEEYNKRKNELIKYIDLINKDLKDKIECVFFPYDNLNYIKDLLPYKDEHEGGKRCFICYEKRMNETYKYSFEHHFDYFTSVMSISRQKNSFKINEIGEKLEKKYSPTKYFYSDFKKNKGIDRARELRIKYNLYSQLYCGCQFSYAEYLKKNKEKK